jgi:hypothetical protein
MQCHSFIPWCLDCQRTISLFVKQLVKMEMLKVAGGPKKCDLHLKIHSIYRPGRFVLHSQDVVPRKAISIQKVLTNESLVVRS